MADKKMSNETEKLKALRRGYYCPSFFKLGVETIFSLGNLNELQAEPAPFSTFFHEYIHFLQDITTSFGLANGCIIIDRVKYANHEVLRQGKRFGVPLSLAQDAITELNRDVRIIYMGDAYGAAPPTITISKVEEGDSSLLLPPPYNKYMPEVRVSFGSKEDAGSFNFGALCVVETMTHIAQNRFHEVAHPAVPYLAAQLVAQHEYDVIGQNDLFVFALCDASLMSLQPGLVFYRALKHMKQDGFKPASERDVFDYVMKNFKAETVPLMSHFSWMSGYATVQYSDYLTTNIFENERQWIQHVLKKAHELRVTNPYYLIDIIKQPEIASSNFIRVLNELGTPLMVNIEGKAWFHPPKGVAHLPISPDRFAAVNEIFSLFEYGQTGCGLKAYCSNCSEGDITDERCDDRPWERAKDDQLCAYAIFWKTWALTGYVPVKSTS